MILFFDKIWFDSYLWTITMDILNDRAWRCDLSQQVSDPDTLFDKVLGLKAIARND